MNTFDYEYRNHTISSKDLKKILVVMILSKYLILDMNYEFSYFFYKLKASQSIKIQPLFMTVTISGLFFFLHGLIQYTVPMSTSVSFPFSSG